MAIIAMLEESEEYKSMEILNYLSTMDLYQSGLVADSISEVVRAPHFIDTILIDNERMHSDQHTFYIIDLVSKLHPDKIVLTLVHDHENHRYLVDVLRKNKLDIINPLMEYVENEQEKKSPKWRIIKNKKVRKKDLEIFQALREKPQEKTSRIGVLKERFKREKT